MKTFKNSAEKIPPFFMAPLFLILNETERLGCLKWNSLEKKFRVGKLSEKHLLKILPVMLHIIKSKLHQPCLPKMKQTYLGGMFSGLLDQSDTQSALFFKASTSFSPSTASSSD